MDTTSTIDTVQIGYEETAAPSRQPQLTHTQISEHTEVQDALTLANMLQQLRTQTLNGEISAEKAVPHA